MIRTTNKAATMNNKKKFYFISTSLILILITLLSTVIESCYANVNGRQREGGLWMGLARVRNNRKEDKNNKQRIHPVALGIQRALSRSGCLHTNSKLTAEETAAPKTSVSSNNKIREGRKFYDHGVDEESRATRFAFIDHSEEAAEIALTMKPLLKHISSSSSSSSSLSSSLETPFSSVINTRIIRKAAKTTHTIPTSTTNNNATPRGGEAATAVRTLFFWESMVSGAVSRSIAQTVMHPANTMKTMLQSSLGPTKPTLKDLIKPQMFRRLSRGAGANFVLSLPHGAANFAVLEAVRGRMNSLVESVPRLKRNKEKMGPGLDFMSSAIATICCSVVSTPQMMITDNIMAGNYPDLISATGGLYTDRGVMGFYTGWWPGLVGKIPSYALTWTFFQQLKRVRNLVSDRPAKNYENTIMGCVAAATCVCIMIPMDTIKTRLVTQTSAMALQGMTPYKGIVDCGLRISREEGIKTFYRGLAPRLLSVVPMIGIQFGVYEAMKKVMIQRSVVIQPSSLQTRKKGKKTKDSEILIDRYGTEEVIEEAAMETSASASTPFAAPHFLKKIPITPKKSLHSIFGSHHK